MANVLIIDDNKTTAAILKITLSRQLHHVRRSEDIRDAIYPADSSQPDLVLINQAAKNFSGWKTFNYLKQIRPSLPAIVYVLEHPTTSGAQWICKVVDAVLSEIMSDSEETPCFGT
ncbi:response regulator [Desulfosarcina widdelii]|nr:response regulator [Desulfosarcina widdelii]